MSLFLDDGDVRLYLGDAREALADVADGSVHCVATSPPFFGLRDYGTGRWEGGDPDCDHAPAATASRASSTLEGGKATLQASHAFKDACPRCGAIRVDSQIGLEATPFDWASSIVEVMREARRVLRDDGSLWIECGDSYASDVPYYAPDSMNERSATSRTKGSRPQASGELKPTDLIGAPWILAQALRAPYYAGKIANESERAWLAAIIDGEGSIAVNWLKPRGEQDGRQKNSYGPYVRVHNTNEDIVNRCAEIAGVGSVNLSDQRRRPVYVWAVYGDNARAVLREVYPHLVAKQHEARLAYAGRDAATHEALRALHRGETPPLDFAPPPTLWEKGWYLRGAYVWEKPDCLSGGTRVYARTQKGDMPMTVKDLVRLDPATVQLWNGKRWTQAVSWRNAGSRTDALEVELRSGERIGCTPNHLWPTGRGLVLAKDLVVGDLVPRGALPAPDIPDTPEGLPDDEIGWLCGLYLAEGSRKDGMVRFACHADEVPELYARLEPLARRYHGTARAYLTGGRSAAIHVSSRVLEAAIALYVGGGTAKTKKLRTATWQRSDKFLEALFDGYLFGDGHYDAKNDRWRLGFTRNDALASDLRCLSARCGYDLRLRTCYVQRGDERWPAYRGDLRLHPAAGANRKDSGEVVAIRRSRGRQFWDISVADEPHLYALASGTLTHNCMPESVENRCTTSHSYVFHLTKNSEDAVFWTHRDGRGTRTKPKPDYRWIHRETGDETTEAQEGREWKRVNLWRGRPYFFDRDAIREPFSDYSTGGDGGSYGSNADSVRTTDSGPRGSTRYQRPRPQEDEHVQPTLEGDVPEAELRGPDGRRKFEHKTGANGHENYANRDGASRWPSLEGRSPRSVWRITTEASSFGLCRVCRTFWAERAPARHCGEDVVAHFAVWPHELVAKIINAATSEAGCCADCGAPRARRTRSERSHDHTTTADHGLGRRDVDGYGVRDGIRVSTEHLGWQPTCECGSYVCLACEDQERGSSTKHLRGLRDGVREGRTDDASAEVLLEDLREPGDREEPEGDEGLHDQPAGVPASAPAGASDGEPRGVRDGAPARDGREDRTDAPAGGGRPSPERGQVGQPPREPRRDDEVGAQPRDGAAGARDAADVRLSSLRRDDPTVERCGVCGGGLTFRPSRSVPATVLDVFGGSGTTARQARAMGRHAILVELSPDYAEIAAHRLAQQGLALV